MMTLTKNVAALFTIVAFVAFWIVAIFVPADVLREIFNSLSFGMAVMVCITWAPAAYHSFRSGGTEGKWQLVIAVFLCFSIVTFQRLYVILLEYLGRPPWLLRSHIAAFVPYTITVAGALFLIAPSVHQGRPGNDYWLHLVIGVGIGSLLAGILLGRSLLAA